jgi:small subunit ribosomal protein S17
MAKKTENKKQKESPKTGPQTQGRVRNVVLTRGRIFQGTVIRKFPSRVVIEFERTVYIRKFERYAKKKTRVHAYLPPALVSSINLGDYIRVQECRPLSKIIHFVALEKIRSANEETKQ